MLDVSLHRVYISDNASKPLICLISFREILQGAEDVGKSRLTAQEVRYPIVGGRNFSSVLVFDLRC
jgi:hypothetical protein